MKTEEILKVEESAENRINLVRDRLFWQAWNKSAFLFVTHIKKYQVHKKFIQKVNQEVAWLGFPKNTLDKIKEIAINKGWTFEQKSNDHITIDGIPATNGYEKWWADTVQPVRDYLNEKKVKDAPLPTKKQPQLLPAYKTAYDLCLHTYKTTSKLPKNFNYELGARIRNYATDIVENLHLICNTSSTSSSEQNHKNSDAIKSCANTIHKIRIDIRILLDLRLISVDKWGFLNLQIEKLLDYLRAVIA